MRIARLSQACREAPDNGKGNMYSARCGLRERFEEISEAATPHKRANDRPFPVGFLPWAAAMTTAQHQHQRNSSTASVAKQHRRDQRLEYSAATRRRTELNRIRERAWVVGRLDASLLMTYTRAEEELAAISTTNAPKKAIVSNTGGQKIPGRAAGGYVDRFPMISHSLVRSNRQQAWKAMTKGDQNERKLNDPDS